MYWITIVSLEYDVIKNVAMMHVFFLVAVVVDYLVSIVRISNKQHIPLLMH